MATMKENTRTHLIILLGLVFLLPMLSSSQSQPHPIHRPPPTHHPPPHRPPHFPPPPPPLYQFVVTDTHYTRLCSNKTILTVNGQFPGPTVYVHQGDTIYINVTNNSTSSLTIHWHGVKQPNNPWSDGPEYVTQCPLRPGESFNQMVVLSDEIGTLWWHAHSDWTRATVHGAIVVHPRRKNDYPFPAPYQEYPIILGEWWKGNVQEVMTEFLENGGDPNVSDAFVINGQPGDLYPCSSNDTYKLRVQYGQTYLLRIVNAVMNNIMFFKIANHSLTVVGSDGAYVKPFTSDHIAISPGQTIDVLLHANQPPSSYYMAARVYNVAGTYDETTTTAIVEYIGAPPPPANMSVPLLPAINDTPASYNFTRQLRSYNNQYSKNFPPYPTRYLFFTVSIKARPCPNTTCEGPDGLRLLGSMNNITLQLPNVSFLEAYYYGKQGVYTPDFPSMPPFTYNYTENSVPRDLWDPTNGTAALILNYGDAVELVLQGTNTVAGIYHPMHLHGYSFYVVGSGFGNFNQSRDPLNYNLVDPPLVNTIAVPRNGWTAIRFVANNPGVWFMHCHLERHVSWGMGMVFITRNGRGPGQSMIPPPHDYPRCH